MSQVLEPLRSSAAQIDQPAAEGISIANRTAEVAGPDSPESREATSAAPMRGWRALLTDSLVMSAATIFSQAIGVITSFLLRVLVSPAEMGIWQGLKLALSYSNYANLGISKGATREVSMAMGRGDPQQARHAVQNAFAVSTLGSFAYAAAMLIVAAWFMWFSDGPWSTAWAIGFLAVAGLTVVQRFVTYQISLLRARQNFRHAAWLTVLESVATLAACGLCAWLWGLVGLYVGTAMVLLATMVSLRFAGDLGLGWSWDRRAIARLVKIGMPVVITGLAASLFRTIDRFVILAWFDDGEFQLGCYSLALLVSTQLFGFANMLSIVMSPRYSETFGRHGAYEHVARLAARASELQAALLALPAALAILVAPPLLRAWLPEYASGLPALAWLVPGVVAVGLALPTSDYLVAVNQPRRAFVVVAVSAIFGLIASCVALHLGGNLASVAIATSITYFVYLAAMIGVSVWPQLNRIERRRYLFGLTAIQVPTVGTAALLEFVLPSAGLTTGSFAGTVAASWSMLILKTTAVVALWCLAIAWGWRHAGWRTVWRAKGESLAVDAAESDSRNVESTNVGQTHSYEHGKSRITFAERPSLAELDARCQKLEHRRLGNWMARRISRPIALRITWVVVPWGLSAHAVTAIAWLVAIAATVALGWGTLVSWLVAAGLLQLWYLLDHVDGQLARYHRVETIDGAQFDFLMHHVVHLLVPIGIGWGLCFSQNQPVWMALGIAWGVGSLLLGLVHDARYKAMFRRLKCVRGTLTVEGGGGGRPVPAMPMPRDIFAACRWLARKACEIHVVMNVLTELALVGFIGGDHGLLLGRLWLAVMAPLSLVLALITIVRGIRQEAGETEFAAWFRVSPTDELRVEHGWWIVGPSQESSPHHLSAAKHETR